MSQNIETATFDALTLKNPRDGKFETVDTPLLLVRGCSSPFGVELDTRYSALPKFAGGTDPRKYLSLQLHVSEKAAEGFRLLDVACEFKSQQLGDWLPLVSLINGRPFIKARIYIEGNRLTTFSVDGATLLTGWEHFSSALKVCDNLKQSELNVVIVPQYTWSVTGKRGLSLGIEQLAIKKAEPRELIDHFA